MPTNLECSKTVLLLEDLDILRNMVRDFLKSLEIQVLEASNAAEAVQLVRAHPAAIDLLLTDVEMPGLSGLEAARQIAGLRPGISIVFMSAGMSQQEWDGFEEKPSGSYFVQKPFRLEELRALLISILST